MSEAEDRRSLRVVGRNTHRASDTWRSRSPSARWNETNASRRVFSPAESPTSSPCGSCRSAWSPEARSASRTQTARRRRSRAAAFRAESPTRSATPHVPLTPRRGGSSRSACRSSSGRDIRGAKAVQLVHALVWDEPPPKPRPLRGSLAFTGMACAAIAVDRTTSWLGDERWQSLVAAALTVAPLAGLWLWASLHLPHGDADWRALLPGALLVAIGLSVLHELVDTFSCPSSSSRGSCTAPLAP